MRCFWIDSINRQIKAVDYSTLADIRTMTGGHIEACKIWPTGDVLYVDEEGLLKAPPAVWFVVAGVERPIAGSGVVVGREIGDTADTQDPELTLDQLTREVRFVSLDQVRAWAAANSSDPFVTISTADGQVTVVARTGEVYGAAPPKTDR